MGDWDSGGGLDLRRFLGMGFGGCSADKSPSGSSMSHLERFLEGVEGPGRGSSVDMARC